MAVAMDRMIRLDKVVFAVEGGPHIAFRANKCVRPRIGEDGRLSALIVRTLEIKEAEMISLGDIVHVETVVTKDAYGNLIEPPLVHSFGRLRVVFNHPRFEPRSFVVQTLVMVPA